MGMTLKRLTKCAIRDVAKVVIGEVPAIFDEEVFKRISAATYVATFADHMEFMESWSNVRMTSLHSCNLLARKCNCSHYTPSEQD